MKVPRKSTSIDMTAMCDVAFLLLSFFIFTAKMKKSEEVEITTPNSVHSDTLGVKNKFNITVNVAKDGTVLLGLDNDSMMKVLAKEVNTQKSLGLTDPEIEAFSKKTSVGMDFGKIKPFFSAALTGNKALQEGIVLPKNIKDTAGNQLRTWILITAGKMFSQARAANAEMDPTPYVYIRADKEAPYKVVDKVMTTFSKMNLDRFKLVTTPEDAPVGSALYESNKNPKKDTK